jgi:hypothetical protein
VFVGEKKEWRGKGVPVALVDQFFHLKHLSHLFLFAFLSF